MLKSGGLRSRYLVSILLVMIPILLLSVILFTSNYDRSMQYINNTNAQNFAYAVQNVSSVLTRLDSFAKTAFILERNLSLDPLGAVTITNENGLCASIAALESRIAPEVKVLLYVKGDRHIYSSGGKMLYGDFERQSLRDYNLSHSALFSKLQRVDASALFPLCSVQDSTTLSGLAYVMPFPTNVSSNALMCFVLSDQLIVSEFENYLGSLRGSLYLFDSGYNLLYAGGSVAEGMPAANALRIHGAGAIPQTYEGRKLVILRASSGSLGLHWVWVAPQEVFYASMKSSQRLTLLLITILVALTLGLIVWIAFFNYKPIQELLWHVTGNDRTPANENELELISNAYDQTADEAEALSARLDEMTPLIAQQFVRRLIFGEVRTQERFQTLCSRAGIDLSHPWTVAFYLPYRRKEQETHMEQAVLAASRFMLPDANVALGDLLQESALCVLINFAFSPTQTSLEALTAAYADQLYKHMAENGSAPEVIGIGKAYQDPLRMHESFAEACAAVQLVPAGHHYWHYSDSLAENSDSEDFHGLSPLSISLLNEGLHRGDKDISLHTLDDMLQQISNVTHSLAFFRFYSSELLSVILHQANSLQLPVAKTRIQRMITFSSSDEFAQAARKLVSELCDVMQQRIRDNDQQLKQNLLNYILANYKRSDLSIQTVSDETGIRKAQITTLIKEETGQGFVQYVSYLRLNEFKRLLVQRDSTIRDLVEEIGYNDVSNFLRKFKTIEGVTPSLYRQLHKK